jgi:hypothetical protein
MAIYFIYLQFSLIAKPTPIHKPDRIVLHRGQSPSFASPWFKLLHHCAVVSGLVESAISGHRSADMFRSGFSLY